MNFALIGYGRMGHAIEALGNRQGHAFPLIIDEHNQKELNQNRISGIDAAIEFTLPSSAPANIRKCIDLKLPVVCGTTGWNEQIPQVEAYCREQNGTLFHASNFSVGVNILFALNKKLAQIMVQFPEYRAGISEVHHVHKKDAPSGTAISLAEQILEGNPGLMGWFLKKGDQPQDTDAGQLPIEALRKGEVKGKHSIHYESPLDSISLSHEARSRDAFAAGVLLAARFIKDRKGVFGMQDLLKL
jgi:4-hydroxy-tetrahydrodipicolinate reductase